MHTRTQLWLVTLLIVLPKCASVGEGSRTYVTADGRIARATVATHGCGGQVLSSEEHTLVGGQVGVTHEARRGMVGGVAFGAMQGTRPDDSRYEIGAGHARVGYSWPYGGVDGGVNVWLTHDETLLLPTLQGRFGRLDRLWGEVQLGAREHLIDLTLFSASVAGRYERFQGKVGLGWFGRPAVDRDEGLELESLGRLGDLGARVEATVDFGAGWALALGGIINASPSGFIGFRYELGSREPDDTIE